MELDEQRNELTDFTSPLVVIFVLSYIISDMFMDLFDMSINTIIHCYIADEEMFSDGDQQTRYADERLKKWFDLHNKNVV